MVSTLKLTKIQIPNSDSDVLSFNSSTGIMTFHKDIKGEGTNTTNLQQGLAKAFSSINGASTAATRGTFNMSSLNDTGTGQYTITITNPMANTNYTGHISSGDHDDTADSFTRQFIHTFNTANISVFIAQTAGSYYDTTYIGCTIHGDLA